MKLAIRLGVFLLTSTFAGNAFSQGPNLTWKSLDGKKPFYVEMTTTTEQSMTVSETTNKQWQKHTFWFHWSPQGRKNGKYEVVQKILGADLDLIIGGTRIRICSFDRESNPPPSAMRKFFDTLVGAESTLIINTDTMAVEKVKQTDLLLKKLTTTFPKMKDLYKHVLSEQHYRQSTGQMFRFWPRGGVVPKSKRWTADDTMDMGPIGKFVTRYHYRYLGKKGRFHHIEFKCDQTHVPPKQPSGALPFIIESTNLKFKDCRGEILFDAKTGRLADLTSTMRIEGKMEVKIANNSTPIELIQVQTIEIRMKGRNPITKRKRANK